MIPVLVVNLLIVALAIVLPNEFLKWHSWGLYGVQMATLLPYLLRRVVYARTLFLPTLFVLVYYLVNLTFGSYLVPRGFGWNKEYTDVALRIESYNLIVPYLTFANVILFLLTCWTMEGLSRVAATSSADAPTPEERGSLLGLAREVAFVVLFFVVSSREVFNAFSFQLAILIIHLSELARRRTPRRWAFYALYLVIFVSLDYDNKREIAMALFLVLFLETFYGRHLVRVTVPNLIGYALVGVGFMGLIMAASILRGYGGFRPASLFDAVTLIPRYIGSDLFVDGLTDNLELNYSYGTAITAFDLTIAGKIPYQYGASLWKVLFLPIPRELFPEKPESVMQLFTRTYAPEFWAADGSLPVVFSADMFVNFWVFGLWPFALVWAAINRFFVGIHTSDPASVGYYSGIFLCITVLMFARGSGLEQYLLYYLIALPVLLAVSLTSRRRVRTGPSRSRAPTPAPRAGRDSPLLSS